MRKVTSGVMVCLLGFVTARTASAAEHGFLLPGDGLLNQVALCILAVIGAGLLLLLYRLDREAEDEALPPLPALDRAREPDWLRRRQVRRAVRLPQAPAGLPALPATPAVPPIPRSERGSRLPVLARAH